MAVGQQVPPPVWDVGAMTAAQNELVHSDHSRSVVHARQLRGIVVLHGVLGKAKAGESTATEVAMLLSVSEFAARALLEQAVLLSSLPGGLEAVECGLLRIEQAVVLTRRLSPLSPEVQRTVWASALVRLQADVDQGVVRSPARLGEALAAWILKADPAGATARRKAAAQAAEVDFRRREDGLGDLFAFGIPNLQLQAILLKVRALSQPWGSGDLRPAGQRRIDALVDLLLNRAQPATVESSDEPDPFAPAPVVRPCGSRCGCRAGEPVPCGLDVSVLLPIGAGLGTTTELAQLVGSGPLEDDLTAAVLGNAPRLRPVWVDENGLPVAIGEQDQVVTPPRGDLAAVRQALLGLLALPPPDRRYPRHPDDHQHLPETDDDPEGGPSRDDDVPTDRAGGGSELTVADDVVLDPEAEAHTVTAEVAGAQTGFEAEVALDSATTEVSPVAAYEDLAAPAAVDADPHDQTAVDGQNDGTADAATGPQLLRWPHPADMSGAYRVAIRLTRLLRARSPRCEWPSCGRRASRCDLDHDRAWPAGPTCACNLGPLCRFHHQRKQQLMRKTRQRDGSVRWADPTGRRWTSPSQHPAPEPPVRTLPGLRTLTEQERSDRDAWAGEQDLGCSLEHGCALEITAGPGTETLTGPGVEPLGCAHLDPLTDRLELRADDPFDTPLDDIDVLGELILMGDGWGLALDDHTRWGS